MTEPLLAFHEPVDFKLAIDEGIEIASVENVLREQRGVNEQVRATGHLDETSLREYIHATKANYLKFRTSLSHAVEFSLSDGKPEEIARDLRELGLPIAVEGLNGTKSIRLQSVNIVTDELFPRLPEQFYALTDLSRSLVDSIFGIRGRISRLLEGLDRFGIDLPHRSHIAREMKQTSDALKKEELQAQLRLKDLLGNIMGEIQQGGRKIHAEEVAALKRRLPDLSETPKPKTMGINEFLRRWEIFTELYLRTPRVNPNAIRRDLAALSDKKQLQEELILSQACISFRKRWGQGEVNPEEEKKLSSVGLKKPGPVRESLSLDRLFELYDQGLAGTRRYTALLDQERARSKARIVPNPRQHEVFDTILEKMRASQKIDRIRAQVKKGLKISPELERKLEERGLLELWQNN